MVYITSIQSIVPTVVIDFCYWKVNNLEQTKWTLNKHYVYLYEYHNIGYIIIHGEKK